MAAGKLRVIFNDGATLGLGTTNADRGIGDNTSFTAYLDVTASTGTTPTLDITIEEQDPFDNWSVIDTFTQATGTTTERRQISANVDSNRVRAAMVVGGTATPTFTFTLGALVAP